MNYLIIPCYNEADVIASTLHEICALNLDIKILVLDDGSTDQSVSIVRALGIEVLELEHQGLAQTHLAGLKEAHQRDAHSIINLDADAQYDPRAIPLILEHLDNGADLVIAERGKEFYQRMTSLRRWGHRLGRWVTHLFTGLKIHDPVSGYRGYSRRAAQCLDVRSDYSYTLETLVEAGLLQLKVATLTIEARPTERSSRLIKHPLIYCYKQAKTLISAAISYRLHPAQGQQEHDNNAVSTESKL